MSKQSDYACCLSLVAPATGGLGCAIDILKKYLQHK